MEEQIRAERELRLKFEEERKKIEEEERKKNIEKINLDIKVCKAISQAGGWGILGSLALGGAGFLIGTFCPVAGICMLTGSLGGTSTSMISFVGGKIAEIYFEYKKSQIK